MVYFLSIAGYEQEISLDKLNEMIPILLNAQFGFSVRVKRK
jgi:hypothetical protein